MCVSPINYYNRLTSIQRPQNAQTNIFFFVEMLMQ